MRGPLLYRTGREGFFLPFNFGSRRKTSNETFPNAIRRPDRRSQPASHLYSTVIIAVIAVGMVQVTTHQIVPVPAVRHCLMPTARSVLVALVVLSAIVTGGALVRIRGSDCKLVVVHMLAVLIMEMPIVQVICVSVVLDGGVTASCLVFVTVPLVGRTCGAHRRLSLVLA